MNPGYADVMTEDGKVERISGFDIGSLEPSQHAIIQVGNYIECKTPGHKHGSRIQANKILNKKDGKYILEDMIPIDVA